ncbi:MAG: ankyrin repeat domain-containing protein [Brevinemataceae bacterium]
MKYILCLLIILLIHFPSAAQINELFLQNLTNISGIFSNDSSAKNNSNTGQTDSSYLNVIALFEAVESNNIQKISTILSQGIDVNSRNFAFRTPLMCTTDKSLESAKFLLTHGAYLNTRDNQGNTFLMIASESGYIKLVEFILSQKTQNIIIDTVNRDNYSALDLAVKNGHTEIVKLLVNHDKTLSNNARNSKLLIESVKNNYLTLTDYLLSLKADPNTQIPSNKTSVLGLASALGYLEIAELLIQNNADVNKTNIYGVSPLFLAIAGKKHDIIKLLLQNGASVDLTTTNNLTINDFINDKDHKTKKILKQYLEQNKSKSS